MTGQDRNPRRSWFGIDAPVAAALDPAPHPAPIEEVGMVRRPASAMV